MYFFFSFPEFFSLFSFDLSFDCAGATFFSDPLSIARNSPLSLISLGKSIAGAPPSSLSSLSDGSPPLSWIILFMSSSIFSSCSGDMPSLSNTFPSIFSTGKPSSLAHFMQMPSDTFSPFSIFVTKTTAIRLWHLEHITILRINLSVFAFIQGFRIN